MGFAYATALGDVTLIWRKVCARMFNILAPAQRRDRFQTSGCFPSVAAEKSEGGPIPAGIRPRSALAGASTFFKGFAQAGAIYLLRFEELGVVVDGSER